ncbi:hypothetical protein, partial [Maribellus sp. YY47]|uniref:hypothetical protein n=1 Tax=Maribellus sp. YY47 TaxID=2929486 RepID=UPI0020017C47
FLFFVLQNVNELCVKKPAPYFLQCRSSTFLLSPDLSFLSSQISSIGQNSFPTFGATKVISFLYSQKLFQVFFAFLFSCFPCSVKVSITVASLSPFPKLLSVALRTLLSVKAAAKVDIFLVDPNY